MSTFESTTPPAGDPGTEGGVVAPVVDPPAGDAGGAAEEVPTPGAAEGGAAEGGVEPVSTPQYLDPEQYGTHLVKIKVGGEDVERPFADVLKSDMLQQDYTRKTQELAEERRKLQQADALVAYLEANPAEALKQLSEVYDLNPETGFGPVERDPQEQQLVEMRRQLDAQQNAITQQQIQNEVAALRAEHGDFDVMATARFAQEHGLRLTDAFRVQQAEQVLAKQQEAAQQEQRRQAALAAQTVHDGTATQRGAVQSGTGKPAGSIQEAWAQAKAALK